MLKIRLASCIRSLGVNCGILALALAILLEANPIRADEDKLLMLVFPVFMDVPEELELPSAARIAESLLMELPANVEAVAQTPAAMPPPGQTRAMAQAQAEKTGAVVAIWGELGDPGSCKAPHVLRINILDVDSGNVLKRNLCPEQADPGALSRAIALVIMNTFRSGLVKSIGLIENKARKPKNLAAEIPKVTSCPEPEPCPKTEKVPEVKCPAPPEPPGPSFFISTGFIFSSHPSWESCGFGAGIDVLYSPTPWFEMGLGVQALRGRHVKVSDVNGLYTDWPLSIRGRVRFGGAALEGTADLGFLIAMTRLEVLFEKPIGLSVKNVTKWNPAMFASLGLRWWMPFGLGLHLQAGPTVYLRRQLYRYTIDGVTEIVMSMQVVSFHASLSLVVPLD
jgi:hypothetical protein